jgi:5,10-methylenetetrahydromethanopterin reductase
MRVGVTLQGVDDPASFGDLASWIEELGYDDLWLTDSSLHAGEVYVYATLALAATTRLRVGLAVTNPITRHPAITANAAATLARLAPGRFVCGIGVGDSPLPEIGCRPAKISTVVTCAGSSTTPTCKGRRRASYRCTGRPAARGPWPRRASMPTA